MPQAQLVSGDPETIPYTHSGAVSAGDILVVNDLTLIAQHDYAANEKGEWGINGGVYEILKDGSSGPTFSFGDWLYWDDSNNEAVASATSNAILGPAVAGAGASDATVRVLHRCTLAP